MVEKWMRQTISDDDDDDDDRHFRNVYTHIKMNTFVGVYRNTLEYCQSNSHQSDRNDVSPRNFFNLRTSLDMHILTYKAVSEYITSLVRTSYGPSALYKSLRGHVRIQLLTYEAVPVCISVT